MFQKYTLIPHMGIYGVKVDALRASIPRKIRATILFDKDRCPSIFLIN